MTFPIVTATAAAFLLILQQILMLSVGMRRVKLKQGVGHGADADLERLVRRHANLAENAAIFLVALALLELMTGQTMAVYAFAAVFACARIAHAIGFSSLAGSHLSDGNKAYLLLRSAGATLSALAGIALGVYLAGLTLGYF
jgi:uncharacterized membrane protein YecN with MAPEG domain